MSGTITILGAGAMGSAMATPLRAAGWRVRMWGTWLDDALLETCAAGEAHPRTGVPLAEGVRLYRSDQLREALDGVDATLLAVASAGLPEVLDVALEAICTTPALLLTSKGFARGVDGNVLLLPDMLREQAETKGLTLPPLVAVGGPCMANEVAAARWTAASYSSRDLSAAEQWASAVSTPDYRPVPTDDEAGVEICAAMKNVYAIAIGLTDGLHEATGLSHFNLRSAIMTQAVREMANLTEAFGGVRSTATALAGIGDLEVTGAAGRNKVYGARIGSGETPQQALDNLKAGQTVEGVPATRLALEVVTAKRLDLATYPLLVAIGNVIDGQSEPAQHLADAVLGDQQG